MSNINQLNKSVKEELEKESPSKKRILPFLFDEQLIDDLQSLPHSKMFALIGDAFKLNPKFFTEKLYKDIKKRLGKLHGMEAVKLLEQYLVKSYGLFGPEYILDNIKEAYNPTDPTKDINWKLHLKTKVSSIFSDLLSRKEFRHLTISDLNMIIDGTFKLDSKFFMDSIFLDFRRRLKKNDRLAVDKYFIEKYSLIEGEHIIHKCNANLIFMESKSIKPRGGVRLITSDFYPTRASISYGSVFITNYRIIAQGNIAIKGGRNPFWGNTVFLLSGNSRRNKTRKTIINTAPVYGYHFSSKIHLELKKWQNYVDYAWIEDKKNKFVEIHLTSETSQAERDEEIHTIYKILSKNIDQIKETIKVLLEMDAIDMVKKRQILFLLQNLRSSEEYQRLTDSEYLEIIETTYKMNPQFFMKNIYPKMISTKKPPFQSIKDDFIALIENLNRGTI